MSGQEDLSQYIGEPGMESDLQNLQQTGHVGEYYEARMRRMCELMNCSDVTNEHSTQKLNATRVCCSK